MNSASPNVTTDFVSIFRTAEAMCFCVVGSEVGCDIEEIRFRQGIRLGKIVFCDNEMKLLGNAFDRLGTFFELWTKKEALLKCMGDGFHRGAKSVDVSNGKFSEIKPNIILNNINFRTMKSAFAVCK